MWLCMVPDNQKGYTDSDILKHLDMHSNLQTASYNCIVPGIRLLLDLVHALTVEEPRSADIQKPE